MDKQELAKKSPMATLGFTTVTPKEESDYDRMIQEKQAAQMEGCCDGYSPYDQYGYKPRPKTPSQDAPHRDSPPNPESTPAHSESPPATEPQSVPQADKKNNKR